MKFSIKDIETSSPDLFASFKINGEPLGNYPKVVGRELKSGIQVNIEEPAELKFTTWFNQIDYRVGIYFRDITSEKLELILEIEGGEPVWISDLTIHSFPDVMIREFENGIVLINPSKHDHTFNLTSLFPNNTFKRLTASSNQDVSFNNGRKESGSLKLNAIDAIFLIKES